MAFDVKIPFCFFFVKDKKYFIFRPCDIEKIDESMEIKKEMEVVLNELIKESW